MPIPGARAVRDDDRGPGIRRARRRPPRLDRPGGQRDREPVPDGAWRGHPPSAWRRGRRTAGSRLVDGSARRPSTPPGSPSGIPARRAQSAPGPARRSAAARPTRASAAGAGRGRRSGGAGTGLRAQHLSCALDAPVGHGHLVAVGDDLHDRGEVAAATHERERDDAHQHADRDADEQHAHEGLDRDTRASRSRGSPRRAGRGAPR